MMCKNYIVKKFLCFFTVIIIIFGSINVNAKENKRIAILYDSYNEYGSEENKLSSIVNIVLSSGSVLDILKVSDYDDRDLSSYDSLVVLYNETCKLPGNIMVDLSKYNRNIIWIGKNFNEFVEYNNIVGIKYEGTLKGKVFLKSGNRRYSIEKEPEISKFKVDAGNIKSEFKYLGTGSETPFFIRYKNTNYFPYFSYNDMSYNILRKQMGKILNNDLPKEEKRYLLIDRVYPFMDLKEFVDKVDFLHDNGITFYCSVMPVYDNTKFDAMKRFAEVLKYAQDKGGRMVLHYSDLFGENIPGDRVDYMMAAGQKNYVDYGVYPLALDIPEAFLCKDDYKNLVTKSDTIFTTKYEKYSVIASKNCSIDSFKNVIEKVNINDNNIENLEQLNCNTALTISSDLSLEAFKKMVTSAIKKNILFNDVSYLDMSLNFNGISLKSSRESIFLNDKSVFEKINVENENNKSKSDKKADKNSVDLTNTNKAILKVTFFICGLFVIITLISFRIDKKKYFK